MPANVSLDEAVKRINAEKTGKVLATKVETVDDQKFYVIKILTAEGIIQYLKINVASGKVVE
ncbi:PepSY domain-containing protein [methane-oxidizing endosymbiont of Gigantopelta aegis]|uniref:PepSY domain-containing protein n=1 Tax=methane-oxidizing endosymbiont of Gigantopelta aegis TaxID=2794938 RepID=UPI003CC99971